MGLYIIEENGDLIFVSCFVNYFEPKECNKYHNGMGGCSIRCPYLEGVLKNE